MYMLAELYAVVSAVDARGLLLDVDVDVVAADESDVAFFADPHPKALNLVAKTKKTIRIIFNNV